MTFIEVFADEAMPKLKLFRIRITLSAATKKV
jgi:hypothetical protein